MTTNVYFIRHAQPERSPGSTYTDAEYPLTEKGMRERALVTAFLWNKDINAVLSSPFKRAYDTVSHFAAKKNIAIETDDGFRERASTDRWLEKDEWPAFTCGQWKDFDYKLPNGDSLNETRARNIAALERALKKYAGKNIAVGSHGTAMSTVINYFDKSYVYENFRAMAYKMPWAVKFAFDTENGGAVSLSESRVLISAFDLSIRPMVMDDYARVVALWQDTAGLGKTALDDTPEKIAVFLERNPGISYVVDIGGRILGVMLAGHDGRRASIYHAAVSEQYQGLGLGKAMLHAVYGALREEGIRKAGIMVFKTNTGGDAFWQSEGFILRDDLNFRNREVPGLI